MTAAATTPAFKEAHVDPPDDDGQEVDENAADDQGDDTADTDSGDTEEDWKAKFEAQQRINRTLERRTKRDARKIAELEGVKPGTSTKDSKDAKPDAEKPAGEVDVEKIRAEAVEQAKNEARQEALKERVLDKIEVKAAKDFTDAADAVAMLMRDHEIDDFLDGGKVDAEAIQDALKELLEKKPYLGVAAQGGKSPRFQGSAEGGAKPQKPARPQSLDEAVKRSFRTS